MTKRSFYKLVDLTRNVMFNVVRKIIHPVKRGTFIYLPNEIWELIFEKVYYDDIASLRLVDKRFYSICNHFAFPFKHIYEGFYCITDLTTQHAFSNVELRNKDNVQILCTITIKDSILSVTNYTDNENLSQIDKDLIFTTEEKYGKVEIRNSFLVYGITYTNKCKLLLYGDIRETSFSWYDYKRIVVRR